MRLFYAAFPVTVFFYPLLAEAQQALKVVNLSVGETVNMRSAPSVNASIIAKLPHDAGVIESAGECVAQAARNWCHVTWKNHSGWIADAYLQSVDKAGKAPPAPSLQTHGDKNSAGEKHFYFVYHQKEPPRNPTGCMKADVTKLPSHDDLAPVEAAIGKQVIQTSCCMGEYIYFGSKDGCYAYIRANYKKEGKEEDPIVIPDEARQQ